MIYLDLGIFLVREPVPANLLNPVPVNTRTGSSPYVHFMTEKYCFLPYLLSGRVKFHKEVYIDDQQEDQNRIFFRLSDI